MAMAHRSFENLTVYQLSESLCDEIWDIVIGWRSLAGDTVGKQLIRAADSIGANIAEGCGHWSYQDNRRFVRIARGSLNETRHWLRQASRRKLLTDEQVGIVKKLLDDLAPCLNGYLRSIGRDGSASRESPPGAPPNADAPPTEEPPELMTND
jgi:four helix bundle protein